MGSNSHATNGYREVDCDFEIADRRLNSVFELFEALNRVLYRKRLVVTTCDTASSAFTLSTGYSDMHESARLESGLRNGIYIPVGAGITIPIQPLEWRGGKYPATVDIVGDHVQIVVPYLFFEDKSRVDRKMTAITAFRDLD